MKLLKVAYLFLACVFFCSASLEAELTPIKLNFDGREWVLGFKNETDSTLMAEFILKGESIDKWSELVTIHGFTGPAAKDVQPFTYYQKFIQEITQHSNAQQKLLSQNSDSVLFEWWTEGAHPEHEWVRVLKDPDGYYVLRYTTRKIDQVPEQGKVWAKLLSEAQLEPKGPASIPGAHQMKAQVAGSLFIDPKYKFALLQPEGWSVSTYQDNGIDQGYVFMNPEKNASMTIAFPWQTEGSETAFQELKQYAYQDGGKLIKTLEIERVNGEVVKGEVIGPVSLNKAKIRVNLFFVLLPTKKYSQAFMFSANEDNFDEYLPLFKEVVRTYQTPDGN